MGVQVPLPTPLSLPAHEHPCGARAVAVRAASAAPRLAAHRRRYEPGMRHSWRILTAASRGGFYGALRFGRRAAQRARTCRSWSRTGRPTRPPCSAIPSRAPSACPTWPCRGRSTGRSAPGESFDAYRLTVSRPVSTPVEMLVPEGGQVPATSARRSRSSGRGCRRPACAPAFIVERLRTAYTAVSLVPGAYPRVLVVPDPGAAARAGVLRAVQLHQLLSRRRDARRAQAGRDVPPRGLRLRGADRRVRPRHRRGREVHRR